MHRQKEADDLWSKIPLANSASLFPNTEDKSVKGISCKLDDEIKTFNARANVSIFVYKT